jgi:peroxiredoxin
MPTLTVGDPAPWFITPTIAQSEDCQDIVVGGYRAVLFFFGSARDPRTQAVLADFVAAAQRFADQKITVLGHTIDPSDRGLQQSWLPQGGQPPTLRFLWDFDGELSRRYGVCQVEQGGGMSYDPTTFILDENLHITDNIPLETHIPHVERVLREIERLPARDAARKVRQQAPVLLIPHVFPVSFCQHLMELYATHGGTESGFMKQEADKAVVMLDRTIKRRRDWMINDPTLLRQINQGIGRRVIPEVEKAFQFRITNFERYLVGCYEDTVQGFFKPHRDNVNVGAAHRRFAMTLNLNAGYEGGCLRFPEYSDDLYSPEPGSAVIFSCSLLHEVTPVTQGCRYALLSFFYNEEDAKRRSQTQQQIIRKEGILLQPEVGNQPINAQANAQANAQPEPQRRSQKQHKNSALGFQHKSKKK